jgi:co-chaperonin GroES (HSP10)
MLHSIRHDQRRLIVVGDRVLVRPDTPEDRTQLGLILPQTVVEKEKIQTGRIVAVGPGIPLPDPIDGAEDEPWKPSERRARFIPMQAEEGDYVVFLRKAAIEIKFENEEYLVVPQAGILLLLRDSAER